MVKRVQLVRHNGTDAGNFVGREGEVTVNMTDDCAIVHDGETPGGIPQARADLANSPAATGSAAGKMSATDKAKLNAIESGAQVNPDAAEIKSLYESNPDTNAFTDADETAVRTDLPAADVALGAEIDAVDSALDTHIADTGNPHNVTAEQAGLKIIDVAEAIAGVNTDEAYVTAALLKQIIDNLSGHLGDHKWGYYDPASIPDGWILGYDAASGVSLTIGNAASGADYAGDEYQALFNRIYLRCTNSVAPVSGGRGVDAAADWAANKTITIPNASGRTLVSSNPAAHDSLSVRAPGEIYGEEEHLLTANESGLRSHTHTVQSQGATTQIAGDVDDGIFVRQNTGVTGANNALNAIEAHENMQPSITLDMIIKYR